MTEISKTADKALAILVELADGEAATPQQISLRLGVNRTVVQRLLMTLLAREFVVRSRGEYMLAPRITRLSASVYQTERAAVKAHGVQLSKKLGETVVLQVPDGVDVVVLEEFIQNQRLSIQVRHDVASRSALTQTASGLAILATMDRRTAQRRIKSYGGDVQGLSQTVEKIRADGGFAQTSNSLQAGVSGLALAVRQGNSVMGSLGVLVPTTRVADLDGYREPLARAVRRIERSLA
ncbi:MAG TPA: helix-turn-helix domain-containing protein [Pseudolysinimonas sp.]|nr:helix-turn-helix domain-containing protein [Pseudolysinimonas sp.]